MTPPRTHPPFSSPAHKEGGISIFGETSTDFLFVATRDMDVLPMCSIFQELQIVHDTGYFSALPSLEEYWQQVNEDVDVVVVVVGVYFLFFF